MKTLRQCLLLILLLAVVCCFVLVPVSSASADPFLDGKIKVQLDRISSWEKTGQIVGWLIFTVFFLGVVVSALQAAKTRATKITAGALSLLSAVIVGFKGVGYIYFTTGALFELGLGQSDNRCSS